MTTLPRDLAYGLLISLDLSLHAEMDRLQPDAPRVPPEDVLERLAALGYVEGTDEDRYWMTLRGAVAAALLITDELVR